MGYYYVVFFQIFPKPPPPHHRQSKKKKSKLYHHQKPLKIFSCAPLSFILQLTLGIKPTFYTCDHHKWSPWILWFPFLPLSFAWNHSLGSSLVPFSFVMLFITLLRWDVNLGILIITFSKTRFFFFEKKQLQQKLVTVNMTPSLLAWPPSNMTFSWPLEHQTTPHNNTPHRCGCFLCLFSTSHFPPFSPPNIRLPLAYHSSRP